MSRAERCPTCRHVLSESEEVLTQGLVKALVRVWEWSKKTGRYRFRRGDINHLIPSYGNASANFGKWILFGGLMFRPHDDPRKGNFEFNIERTEAFMSRKLKIPRRMWKNPITKECSYEEKDLAYIDEFPHIKEFLDEDGYYITNYRNGAATLPI